MMRICALSLLVMLAACNTRSVEITSRPLQIQTAQVADPAAVQMAPITLRVVTPDSMDAFMAQLREQQGVTQTVFVAMSMRDYENLALNLGDLARYIEQQKAVITYYRQITAPVPNN